MYYKDGNGGYKMTLASNVKVLRTIKNRKGITTREMIHVISTKCVILCMLLYLNSPLNADIPWLHVEGNRIKDPNGNIVVLRGVSLIDLGFLEDWQGGAINMINRLTDRDDSQGNSPGWYPKILRIPIHPPDSVDNWPYRWGPNDDRFYNGLLRPVVDYCADKDLYVILDWHYIADTWDKVMQTSEFWEYMAPRFANDSHVLFELFNEPINAGGSDTNRWLSVRDDMQIWVDIVRSYAPNNLILVGGPSWAQIIGPAATYPVSGSNIVYVSHIYPAHWLSIYGDRWWFVNHITTCAAVHPVIMTEWGFTTTSETLLNGTISGYGQPLMDFIERLGIGNTAWCASYNWGPPMFNEDWTLRCGEGEMGCFVKDVLYKKRNDDQPYGIPQTPFDLEYLSTEDFETDDFSKFSWSSYGDKSWDTTRQEKYSGNYSAQAGLIEDGESSTLEVSLDCLSGDITFHCKVSSESGYDYLKFCIDGVEKGAWSGEEDWAEVSFQVDEGSRTFEWTYSKDDSVSDGDDTAWIDDIVFPIKIDLPIAPEPPDNTNTNYGFDLYLDYIAPNIINSSWLDKGILDYYCQDNPASGNYCIHWAGAGQYSAISFRFVPAKDLSELVDEGFAIDFWVRCDSPSARIDIRFVDTKTDDPGDHPWRMRYGINRNVAVWDGEWNHLQIPLNAFSEHGSWDNGWFGPIGAFDWAVTEYFEIVAEYGNLSGIHFYFDDVRVVDPNLAG
jgi:endoglucanase